ncbi:MAG: SAM-dependent methyltransferase [Bacteroidetes bacterium]|nr:SAM-dependent methyltransferase [Bacteroidota bacterium]
MTPANPSSFKDPDGSIIYKDGSLFRLISQTYKGHYNTLITSGLYKELSEAHMLINHEEVDPINFNTEYKNIYKVLKPQLIPFISYPYEWSFMQLKAAALLTLDIQLKALEKNMWLKDANCSNIQFIGVDPIFIDTSSFENYSENSPWPAYGQFCRHFLGPLLLFAYKKPELSNLSIAYSDGIPLNIVSYSLPSRTKLNFFIFLHIHYHATLEMKFNRDVSFRKKKLMLSKSRLIALITHLKSGIQKLDIKIDKSEWSDYYKTFSYSNENYSQKQKAVLSFIESAHPNILLDMGCNEGEFSLLCSQKVKYIIATDSDAVVVNNLAKKLSHLKIKNILPLAVNMAHPTPGIGLFNKEHTSFIERASFDAILALALIHHLAIGHNIPFELIAEQFAAWAPQLLIEFVPKEDSQVQKLLITKKDIYSLYTQEHFLRSFNFFYRIKEQYPLDNSGRILFWMETHA